MTIAEGHKHLLKILSKLYDLREAQNIGKLVFEKITHFSATERLMHKQDKLSSSQQMTLENITTSLQNHVPLQYVLEEGWFFGMPFYVDKSVLIPRPETEELVEWILDEHDGKPLKVLDIGTGSGCIPIALKKNRPKWTVWALDKYADALKVAEKNAANLHADIHFVQQDLMDKKGTAELPEFDIFVSNPPYIPLKEKEEMGQQIVGQEPDNALFVPDNNPFIFYEKIVTLSEKKLKFGGKVFVEIHEDLGLQTKALFEEKFDKVGLKKDLSGKNRMICGRKL